jgi:class 3 adenylate cyclase
MPKKTNGKEVAILLTDMVGYSMLTQHMPPEEIRDFIVAYYQQLHSLLMVEEFQPLTIEPSAGDGAIIIFEKREENSKEELCSRALQAAIACNRAIDLGVIPATRMGLFLGDITEAKLGDRLHKFGASFAVANRLEELCGYYDTTILMDREVARKQHIGKEYIVAVGKVTPNNFTSPFNLFTIMKPGLGICPHDVDDKELMDFIRLKNEAIDLFCGNLMTGLKPDFPLVRELLSRAQNHYIKMIGKRDVATDRILEYIREFPFPEHDFKFTGMKVGSKKGNLIGAQLFHLSKQLLRAIDLDLYNALVVNTDWEQCFKLEWRKKDEVIVTVGDPADGIYYLDSGKAHAVDSDGNVLAFFTEGSIFGEMAYYNKEKKRSATVIADSNVVLRKVSNEDFEKLPIIKSIFYRLAQRRRGDQRPFLN